MAKNLRVAIVGSDTTAVFGRELLINSQPDLKVVYLASSFAEALEPLSLLTFDVLLVDQVLSDSAANAFLTDLGASLLAAKQDLPPTVVATAFHSKKLELSLIDAGATSVLSLEQSAADLLFAIRNAREEKDNFDLTDLVDSFQESGVAALADASFMTAIFDLDEAGHLAITNLKSQLQNLSVHAKTEVTATKLSRGLRSLTKQLGLHTTKQTIYRLWQAGELGY